MVKKRLIEKMKKALVIPVTASMFFASTVSANGLNLNNELYKVNKNSNLELNCNQTLSYDNSNYDSDENNLLSKYNQICSDLSDLLLTYELIGEEVNGFIETKRHISQNNKMYFEFFNFVDRTKKFEDKINDFEKISENLFDSAYREQEALMSQQEQRLNLLKKYYDEKLNNEVNEIINESKKLEE